MTVRPASKRHAGDRLGTKSKSRTTVKLSDRLLESLEWRCIGPFRGSRVVAVAGDPRDSFVFYFGACAGGVWKTEDGGTYWENVSDGFFRTAAVGAIAVADADPNTLFAGTGESCIRNNVSHGDGVYKSVDGGRTWKNVGLAETRHIARIRIHPRDADLVYVAALGHAFGPNVERGVYRSRDGGRTWDRILHRGEDAGAIDLCLDPKNPRVLYASFWEARRYFWVMQSGGPGSGIFKSTDGGDTWVELTGNPGLPSGGMLGRIGIAVSPARSGRVWAIIEAEGASGGVYRSDDGGDTWMHVSDNPELQKRPWYYGHIYADPQDPDTVYCLCLKMWKSTDGGHNFSVVTTPHWDTHDLWIDPSNPRRMINGNDGGACVSFTGGATWSSLHNQPTAQIYHVATDNQFPYRVYGTQQDNTAISVPSRADGGVIPWSECYPVGNSESGHIAVRPDNSNVVYSGAIGSAPGGGGPMLRYDHVSRQTRIITVWPENFGNSGADEYKYRFAFTYPIVISPHDPNILYAAANIVFRSKNEGGAWEAISPDLTRQDVTKMTPNGPVRTSDKTPPWAGGGCETYCTVFAFAESPVIKGLLWAGTDDGLLHISRDGGRTWHNVTPKALPEWSLISTVEPSSHDPAVAYVAAARWKLDDFEPYLFKTDDYGKTWQKITEGIPDDEFARVIREDPVRRGLLYTGTEKGVFVSFDAGDSWQSLQNNLPVVPIYDLVIKNDDLIATTHGRSFWILDNVTPLRQLTAEALRSQAFICKPRSTYRLLPPPGTGTPANPGKNYQYQSSLGVPATYYDTHRPNGQVHRTLLDVGQNPPIGVIIDFYLGDDVREPVQLKIRNSSGQEIQIFRSATVPRSGPLEDAAKTLLNVKCGLNRFVWDMRYPNRRPSTSEQARETGLGTREVVSPLAIPGTYRVVLAVGSLTLEESFEIRQDPRSSASQEDLEAQFNLLWVIEDKLAETDRMIIQIRSARQQAEAWMRITQDHGAWRKATRAAKSVIEELIEIESQFTHADCRPWYEDKLLTTRLHERLAILPSVVSSADAAPTQQAYEVFKNLSARIDQQIGRATQILRSRLDRLANLARELNIPPVTVEPPR